MHNIIFDDLADYLRHGREIEFVYRDREYSITNHSGFWYLCDDTAHVLLETLSRFEDKEKLVSKTAEYVIDGATIQQIFDSKTYDGERLSII